MTGLDAYEACSCGECAQCCNRAAEERNREARSSAAEIARLKAELAEARKERDGLHAQLAAVKEDVEAGEHLIGVMQESAKRLNLKYEGDQEFILLVERQLSAVTRERDEARCDLAAMKCRVALLSGDAANALEAVMKERDSAIADADLLGREVAAWREAYRVWSDGETHLNDPFEAVADTDARPTAAARVKGGA